MGAGRARPAGAGSAGAQERELIKLASLASALAGAVSQTQPRAWRPRQGSPSSESAFERWISETSQADLPQFIRESLDELKAVTTGDAGRSAQGRAQILQQVVQRLDAHRQPDPCFTSRTQPC